MCLSGEKGNSVRIVLLKGDEGQKGDKGVSGIPGPQGEMWTEVLRDE